MKVSWNWLQDWVDLDGLGVDEVVEALTMAGLEVDGLDRRGQGAGDIVVGRIEAIKDHPNADRLVICEVDYGPEASTQVVCGADNMSAGDRVPLARPGSKPPGCDFEIVSREVRGQMSTGMLCSAQELDLADASAGLMILDPELPVGEPIFEALGLDDTVIEIDLTPNRPDCLGHQGVAREIAAIFGQPLHAPTSHFDGHDDVDGQLGGAADAAKLRVDDPDGCPRYLFAVIEDIEVGPSPAWLKARLAAVGLRSVNNVVDVTNYILMDRNQPLHAFDLDALEGPEIRVRRAEPGESLVGIDHQSYDLEPSDLVIADRQRPVAIAGVMGGEATEVGSETTRVLIECAYFNPTRVRKSAKYHGVHTDSSHRFERGIDPAGLDEALARAVSLLVDVQPPAAGPPRVRAGVAEASTPNAAEPATTRLAKDHPERVLGVDLGADQIADYLVALGIDISDDGPDHWACQLPTFRPDLSRPIDLVEEVARMHGYGEIAETLPRAPMGFSHKEFSHNGFSDKTGSHTAQPEAGQPETIVGRQALDARQTMRTRLADFGLYEAVNYGFMSAADLDVLRLPDDDRCRDVVEVANPLVADERFMQTTLVCGLLDNLATNLARGAADVALFEFGRRYFPDCERPTLAILVSGRKTHHWSGDARWDLYDLEGLVEAVGAASNTGSWRWRAPEAGQPYLHPGVQAQWVDGDQIAAQIGQMHPAVAAELDIDQDVFVGEIYLDTLADAGRPALEYTPITRFPAVHRDFALLYDVDRPYGRLAAAIEELADQDDEFAEIFEDFELFDVYAGEQVAADKRSLALTVVYRCAEATLTDEQIERADKRLLDWLNDRVGARLR